MIDTLKNILFLIIIIGLGTILFVILSNESHTRFERSVISEFGLTSQELNPRIRSAQVSFQDIFRSNRTFNISGQDLIILLHIQKTGGTTFERHLVHDLDIDVPCSCSEEHRRCHCPRPTKKNNSSSIADNTWLISRFSTGWLCGLHADWTQLDHCLRGMKGLYFLTNLRHPLHRFVSEYRHVKRGATWRASKSHCKNLDTQFCYYNQSSWLNVSLSEFSRCKNNTAMNRQTRMLADHNFFDSCPDTSDNHTATKDQTMLSSAMKNLRELAFFGICEQQEATQKLFEKTFKLRFKTVFKQSDDEKTKNFVDQLPEEVKDNILRLNQLDLDLYNYALQLFRQRISDFDHREY